VLAARRHDVVGLVTVAGVLEVQADVVGTGTRHNLVIQNATVELEEDELARLLKKMEKLKFHPREQSANIAVLGKAERMWAEALGEERNYIEQLIQHFEKAMDSQDIRRSDAAREEVETRLGELKAQRGLW